MKSLNKNSVAETLAELHDVSKNKASKMIDQVLESIIVTLSQAKDEEPNNKGVRGKLIIVGFGTYELVDVPERTYRVPNTDKVVTKPRHNEIRFSEGKLFREFSNE